MDDIDTLPEFNLRHPTNDNLATERLLNLPSATRSVKSASSTSSMRGTAGSSRTSSCTTTSDPAIPSSSSVPTLTFDMTTLSSAGIPIPPGFSTDADPNMTGTYRCMFHFTGCKHSFSEVNHWRDHTESHVHGRPPRSLQCPYCPKSSTDPVLFKWPALLEHILEHYINNWQGFEERPPAVPDRQLIDCLWNIKAITADQKKELEVHKCLRVVEIVEVAEGEAGDEREEASFVTTHSKTHDAKRTKGYPRTKSVVVHPDRIGT